MKKFIILCCIAIMATFACSSVNENEVIDSQSQKSDTVNFCPNHTLPPGVQFTVPADDAPKDSALNEWFWTTRLVGLNTHKKYSLETFIFNFVPFGPGTTSYKWGQVSLTDPAANLYHQASYVEIGTWTPTVNSFDLSFQTPGAPRATGGGGKIDHVKVSTQDGVTADLYFTNVSNVMAQLDKGFASFTDPLSGVTVGDNYYYTRPLMAAAGTLTINGVTESVVGDGWFDREWDACCFGGYFHNPKINTQWDWAGFNLSDGSSWSYYDIFTQGHRDAKMSVTANFLDSPARGCAQQSLNGTQFTLTHSGAWTSPHTGITYPTSFHFTVPSQGLDVTLVPKITDQEMTALPYELGFTPIYEGWWHVEGTRFGMPVHGDGYGELFGYPVGGTP